MSPVLLIIVIAVIVFAATSTVYVMQQNRAAKERYPNAKLIVPGANFYGQESFGVTQLRGNGILVLTDTELYFKKWLQGREYHIPYAAIQAVETPTSFLGKTNFRPLVKVVFRNDSGQIDSMAWLVRDVEALKGAIEAAIKR
jgi:hypothetical protein